MKNSVIELLQMLLEPSLNVTFWSKVPEISDDYTISKTSSQRGQRQFSGFTFSATFGPKIGQTEKHCPSILLGLCLSMMINFEQFLPQLWHKKTHGVYDFLKSVTFESIFGGHLWIIFLCYSLSKTVYLKKLWHKTFVTNWQNCEGCASFK